MLVGKGITFDTGGLSLKPGEAMVKMKRDMTGGAVVLGDDGRARRASAARCGSIGLVAAAENAVGGTALRPGDVIRHYGGRTTEVTNTDAEGRLVLADALAYAVRDLEADVVVDVATLTGAMKVALGQQIGGFFANDDALAARCAAARPRRAAVAHAARDDYEECSLDVADADNAPGGPGRSPRRCSCSTSSATPWAHLDIASVGDPPGRSSGPRPTGFGARALLHWLGRGAAGRHPGTRLTVALSDRRRSRRR